MTDMISSTNFPEEESIYIAKILLERLFIEDSLDSLRSYR